MDGKPLVPGKLFYNIKEVAEHFNVNASLIRFWDKEFDIIKPRKNAKGNRQFAQEDIETLRLVYHLVKEQGMTLKGAKNRLKYNKEETTSNIEVILKLQNIKSLLLDIKSEIQNDEENS